MAPFFVGALSLPLLNTAFAAVNLSELGFLRVAAVSPAVRVGDVAFNVAAIADAYRQLRLQGVQLAVFPELAVVGYTCGDLLLQQQLLEAAVEGIAELTALVQAQGGVLVVGAPIEVEGRLYNCAVAIGSSGIVAVVPKTYIPNYGEYYEERWFSRPLSYPSEIRIGGERVAFGTDVVIELTIEGQRAAALGIELCEDLWAVEPPSGALAVAGAEVLLNLSASNELLLKAAYRRDLVRMQSARCLAAYVYAGAGTGESTTDMVFSGHCIIAENGVVLAEDRAFAFDTRVVVADIDLDRLRFERRRMVTFGQHAVRPMRRVAVEMPALTDERPLRHFPAQPFVPADPRERAERCREILTIQRTALARRLLHTGQKSVVLGLSGGLDSALALLVCVEAFDALGCDRRNIHAVIMPGPGTSSQTPQQAQQLATALGVDVRTIPITAAIEQHLRDVGHPLDDYDVLFENAQARERTQILMDLCHQYGALMVGTSDLSELALGWTTYGGDHMSMYGVNAGVPKTLVRYIVEWWADNAAAESERQALRAILATPISPELLPPNPDGTIRQRTEEVLGPYVVHDYFLYHFVRCGYSPKKLLATACWAFEGTYDRRQLTEWLRVFLRRFFGNQFKRSCLPDGPKVGTVALSPRGDWRMPSDAEVALWLQEFA